MEIKNKILKSELVEWRKVKWLQNDNLKKIDADDLLKLKRSIVNNSFVMPFHIWESDDGLYFLDGHHREKAMRELEEFGFDNNQVTIPDLLPANFVECADRDEAAKLVLIYSSIYAKVTEEGLKDFFKKFNLNLTALDDETDIPNIKIDLSIIGKEIPPEKLDDAPEPQKNAVSKLGDLFLLDGKHRILCGDSTKKKDVEKLMDGNKSNISFQSPPYNAGNNSLGGNKNRKTSKYLNDTDNKDSDEYVKILNLFTSLSLKISELTFVNLQFLSKNKLSLIEYLYKFRDHFVDKSIWFKGGAAGNAGISYEFKI